MELLSSLLININDNRIAGKLREKNMGRRVFSADGNFLVGIHRPGYEVMNLRENDFVCNLGALPTGVGIENRDNFPVGDIREEEAKWIYEIPNVFPFRGVTYIDSDWAGNRANNPDSIRLSSHADSSLVKVLLNHVEKNQLQKIIKDLPQSVQYALAANSTDPEELVLLAQSCCRFIVDEKELPIGLRFIEQGDGRIRADIDDFELFESIANNNFLPDVYKEVMVLRPGVQGNSEIVGEITDGSSHVFEYFRRNSYIPWGHFAANMANDAIRYKTTDLSLEDSRGLRHLYYQRIFCILAGKAGLQVKQRRRPLSVPELEKIRLQILDHTDCIADNPATLWGWNFGYDISASGYRLHASHQMIHQQYAMVPGKVEILSYEEGFSNSMEAYCCGDLVAEVVQLYKKEYKQDFFNQYLQALRKNRRTDGKEGENSLIVWEDENVMLFVPKAQQSQWEMQLLVTANSPAGPVGNVVEADAAVRFSLDRAIVLAQRIYAELGAKMVTTIEFSKRFGLSNSQRLLYSFLPKLPWSMGAFSEAQLRYISGHFPEDFAVAARNQLQKDVTAGPIEQNVTNRYL